MSQQNVERVREMHALWNTGERRLQDLSAYMRPDVELDSPFSSVAGKPYRGYGGIEQWVGDIDQQFAEWSIVPDDLRDLGDRVLAIATVAARARASGFAAEFPAGCVFDFASDGRVSRMRIFLDVRDALHAVGLEE
jgi:ketosteroid isomerase-like protein